MLGDVVPISVFQGLNRKSDAVENYISHKRK